MTARRGPTLAEARADRNDLLGCEINAKRSMPRRHQRRWARIADLLDQRGAHDIAAALRHALGRAS